MEQSVPFMGERQIAAADHYTVKRSSNCRRPVSQRVSDRRQLLAVVNTRDIITFQGRTVKELRKALKDSIEDYLEFCAERGENPDKPLSGRFVVRIDPELHREVTIAAVREGKSLNKWVAERLEREVSDSNKG